MPTLRRHSPVKLATEHLTGTIERITFYSESSGFSVLKVQVPKRRELVTVTGVGAKVHPGEYIDCLGHWHQDREYGIQFKAQKIQTAAPETQIGIEKYLGSGLIKGIGPGFAKRLVKQFGCAVFQIIEHSPEKLKQVPGFGAKRIETVLRAWEDQKVIRDIVVFLQSHGLGTARAVRIYKTYGPQSIEKIQADPYCLALDIRGIGFKTADELALKLGTSKASPLRLRAGITHTVQEFVGLGHCAVETQNLIEKASALLEVSVPEIQDSLKESITNKEIITESIEGKPCVFLKSYYWAEKNIAKELKRLLQATAPWLSQFNIPKSIQWVESKTGLLLSPSQKMALKTVLAEKIAIITGGPGVGKTTLVNSLLKILRQKCRHIFLGAPTGRAAKRLAESTGLPAKTLHRLLEYDPKSHTFIRNEHTPIYADYLVVDESSMIDLRMMHALLKAIPDNCGVLFVGDVDQLPSVGAGRVLSDLIESGVIPTVRLTEIFRQASNSEIILNAHRINRGKMPLKKIPEKKNLTDFYFIELDELDAIEKTLCELIVNRIPKRFGLDPFGEIQVLSPMNRGSLGVRALNTLLQSTLNPNPTAHITRYGATFATGDKVLQMVNNYDKEIFNGDIGRIASIDLEDQILNIVFDHRTLVYEFSDLDELTLAYATSIHKAQGSEYPAVIMPLSVQHYTLLEKNLLYTGITRGRALVILVGQKKALQLAVKRECSIKRLTNLIHRIQEVML